MCWFPGSATLGTFDALLSTAGMLFLPRGGPCCASSLLLSFCPKKAKRCLMSLTLALLCVLSGRGAQSRAVAGPPQKDPSRGSALLIGSSADRSWRSAALSFWFLNLEASGASAAVGCDLLGGLRTAGTTGPMAFLLNSVYRAPGWESIGCQHPSLGYRQARVVLVSSRSSWVMISCPWKNGAGCPAGFCLSKHREASDAEPLAGDSVFETLGRTQCPGETQRWQELNELASNQSKRAPGEH